MVHQGNLSSPRTPRTPSSPRTPRTPSSPRTPTTPLTFTINPLGSLDRRWSTSDGDMVVPQYGVVPQLPQEPTGILPLPQPLSPQEFNQHPTSILDSQRSVSPFRLPQHGVVPPLSRQSPQVSTQISRLPQSQEWGVVPQLPQEPTGILPLPQPLSPQEFNQHPTSILGFPRPPYPFRLPELSNVRDLLTPASLPLTQTQGWGEMTLGYNLESSQLTQESYPSPAEDLQRLMAGSGALTPASWDADPEDHFDPYAEYDMGQPQPAPIQQLLQQAPQSLPSRPTRRTGRR